MFTNLIEQLSTEDKQKIINYIGCYGVRKEDFIGLDAWLSAWNHANQKLYKILGNQLTREFDFKYTKNDSVLRTEFFDLLNNSTFKKSYHKFYIDYVMPIYEKGDFTKEQRDFFNHLLDMSNFVHDEITYGIKYKAPSAKKMLQVQAGAKPLRAITRVMEYFKDVYNFEGFDAFRVQHSLVMNDKNIKGKICLSIHPLDYMTMSDNASNWQSCMSWQNDGCYRVGTIEMMNSNNVICVYLKNDSTPFVFKNPNTEEIVGEWNNKKWRQLFYVNKDIIMSGKAYPYEQEDITRFVLDTLKALVKENCGWDYEYGIENYTDMRYIDTLGKMEYQRMKMHAKSKDKTKHNIIWDTKGMYNDMLNDNTYNYLCYRNKVNNTKIYSASGKCPCLKCGQPIVDFDENENYYNDRYTNTGAVLCKSCYENYDSCDACDTYSPTLDIKKYTLTNWDINLCKSCADKRIKICPCCGKPMYINYNVKNIGWNPKLFETYKDTLYNHNHNKYFENGFYMIVGYEYSKEKIDNYLNPEKNDNWKDYIEEISLCNKCQNKIVEQIDDLVKAGDVVHFVTKNRWESIRDYYILNPDKYESWRYYNLQTPDEITDVLQITHREI